jgi:hypothetical protein
LKDMLSLKQASTAPDQARSHRDFGIVINSIWIIGEIDDAHIFKGALCKFLVIVYRHSHRECFE